MLYQPAGTSDAPCCRISSCKWRKHAHRIYASRSYHDDGVHTDASAISGNDWSQLAEDSRHAYIAGVTDAWNRIHIRSELAHKKVLADEPPEVERLFGASERMSQCVGFRMLT